MLSATVELLLGTYRADPDGTAHTGRLEQGEWPPSPSRLFAALVAADGTRDRCRYTDGSELEFLEAAPAPFIEAAIEVYHQQLESRFVVKQTGRSQPKKQQQEYVARDAALVRPGVRVTPRQPVIRYLWPVEVEDRQLRALQTRAARIGYLGCADSPVRVRVERIPDESEVANDLMYAPDPDGAVSVDVPVPGRLRLLDAAFDEWTEHGTSVGRNQSPALSAKVRYRSPRAEAHAASSGRIVASLVLRPSLSGRRISSVTATFKAAVLDRFQELIGDPPAELHGHGFAERGYDLAHFLALPDVGHSHARGRIHGVALWLPAACDDDVASAVRDVVHSIRRLVGPGVDASTEVWAGQRKPRAAAPGRWVGPSRRWVTAFPAVHERHVPLTLEEICRWCDHARVPHPSSFRSLRSALMPGAVSLMPSEVHRQGMPSRPYSHLELLFEEPVRGPIVIGSGRQRGFGLCAPVGDRSTLPKPERHRD
ncbi:type I-U CRISPR-associated protein Csb2 [Candidatus Poriferisodalis sp.]|uniref:type I-G CRISPR-associated protein Csb2 n=1 Tax=Candidatus Poriferisodalis sp. TaxID=3101277 RepID=UPI003B020AB0